MSIARIVVAALIVVAAAAPPVRADDAPRRAILVLDASGSMWGRIEGREKIAIARDVIRELVGDWDPALEIGLTAYGHRREGDCRDIEALVPVGPLRRDALLGAVGSIRPVGKTPIAAALRDAARQLDFEREPATLILVSDGRETCDADPCAVARELDRRGLDFTTHVIGFDLAREERDELQCLADATGGAFRTARDASGLLDALRSAIEETARAGPAGVWIAAALAADRQPIHDDVAWQVRRESDSEVVWEGTRPTLLLALEPGRYRARARYAGITARTAFDVGESRRARVFVGLGAARLELTASRRERDAALDSDVQWRIRNGQGQEVAASDSAAPAFTLRAGRYAVEARSEGRRVEREVELTPGQVLRQRVRFGSGRLALRAVLADGALPIGEPVAWRVHAIEPGGRVDPEPAAALDEATCLLELEDGRYRVRARHGDARVERDIEVRAGATRTHTLVLGAGVVRVFGVMPPPGGPIPDPVAWRVERTGDPAWQVRRETASHSFVLPAGRYRVSGRLGGLAGSGEVAVRAGGEASLPVVLRPEAPASAAGGW